MNKKQQKYFLFSFVSLTLISFVVFYEIYYNRFDFQNEVIIENGFLDLSEYKLDNNEVYSLRGDVEFYWNKLLTPEDFTNDSLLQPDGYINIPGIWNNFQYEGQNVGSFGYGTYHFKIKVPEDQLYAIRIKAFETAFTLWANEVELHEGKVGKNESSSTPSWKRRITTFPSNKGEVEVVIQISNYFHRKGGAEEPMHFGTQNAINQFKLSKVLIESFFLGILFMLGVYHLFLYFFMPKEHSNGLFGLIAITVFFRLLTTGEKIILELIPNLNWFLLVRFEYISYTIMLPTMLYFIYNSFKEISSWRIVKSLIVISQLFLLLILITPPKIFSYSPIYFQVIVIFSALYVLYILIIASYKNLKNSIYFLSGYVFFLISIINDILYYNKVSDSGYIMYFGLTAFAISLSIMLSQNFAATFIKNKNLTSKLDLYNKELEATIETRTQFIIEQKDEIMQQAESLRTVNRQIRELSEFKMSLTEMIIHDLKAPLNVILNFSKDQRVLFAGTQMLNLVHNLLDVQRYENKEMKLNLEILTLGGIVDHALYQMNFLFEEKGIVLINDLSTDYFVRADKDILNRVVINLLSNAIKFTPNGGIIKIYFSKNNDQINLCIEDSGPGIPKENEQLIFEKFGQFISNKAGRLGSTGLGLTFCKMAMRAHQGDIYFVSDLGKGTTFCASLPLIESDNNEIKKHSPSNNLFTATVFLNQKEKEVIGSVIDQLENVNVYEFGKIKQLLSQLNTEESDNIAVWIKALNKAIINADKESFKSLISLAKKT